MIDDSPDTPPEVTIEPADNGFIVRHHQRSDKKDSPGRTIRRLALTREEALGHAGTALSGGSAKSSKKKSARDGQTGSGMSAAEGESGLTSSPAAHTQHAQHASRRPTRSARRRRPRIGGRR